MKRIDKLTPEQEARFGEWTKKWVDIGLSTEPADLDKFKDGASVAYKAAGLNWHDNVILVDNPLIMALASPIASFLLYKGAVGGAVGVAVDVAVRDAVRDAVGGAVGDAVDDAVGVAVDVAVRVAVRGAVGDAVDDAVDDAVGDAVGGAVGVAVDDAVGDAVGVAVDVAVRVAVRGAVGVAVRDAVGVAVRDAVGGAVGDAVGDAVGVAVRDAVGDAVGGELKKFISETYYKYLYGQFSVGGWWWGNASATFFRDVCNLELSDEMLGRMNAYEKINCSASMWYPHKDFVIVSQRPHIINRDNNGRLHCENGPSIAWKDFELFHWHGIKIPMEWVTGNKPSAKEALTWENIEQRRAACEIVGWNNVLSELNARTIDEDGDPEIGTLLEADIQDSGKERFLKVRCGTQRSFVLPVPRYMKTAIQANAWTYGLDVKDFKPEVRT